MLMSREWGLPHVGCRSHAFLQSPAEVSALLAVTAVAETALADEATNPEMPARLGRVWRETGSSDYLRLMARNEVERILQSDASEPHFETRIPNAH